MTFYLVFSILQVNSFIFGMNKVVVVLPYSFRGIRAQRNSAETQQSGHAPRSVPEIKDGRSSVKDSMPERLGCWAMQKKAS